MVIYILMTIFVVFFEVSLREINILSNISILFILINLCFWFKRHRAAIICGFISGFLIDLFLQNHLGKSIFSLFCPIFIFTFFDNLLRVDSKMSRTIYLVASTASGVFISDFLFELIFWEGDLIFVFVVKRIIISVVIALLLSLFLGKYFIIDEDRLNKYSSIKT